MSPQFELLYQRLIRLPAVLLPYPRVRKALLWAACIFWFAFATLFLTLRYAVLPHVPEYRPQIEQALSEAIKLPVSIGSIDADWYGLRPRLSLHALVIKDKEGREALRLDEVEAVPAWSSLLFMELRLQSLDIIAPNLSLRRDRDGVFYVAGLRVNTQSQDSGFAKWLLKQYNVTVRDASILWQDELRQAPALELKQLNFRLQNSGSRHRFGLTAVPPLAMADKLDIRGDLRGSDLADIKDWRGELYSSLNYVDLAIWRAWVDYPLELPRGRGAMRLWMKLANGAVTRINADLRLDDVQVRFARDLPFLQLQHLSGQLGYQRSEDGETISANQLGLTTLQGLTIPPADFALQWQKADDGQIKRAEFSASQVDLLTLRRFSDYLPLPKSLRDKLDGFDPRGQLQNVRLGWRGQQKDGNLQTDGFIVKANFLGLSVAAQGLIPGVQNLSGEVDGNEESGKLNLAGRNMVLQMPRVFPEPNLSFSTLDAKLKWRREGEGNLFTLDKFVFQNADTHGSLGGTYRSHVGTLGEIDLEGKLLATDGKSVWRYLPYVVNKNARDWVRTGILGGIADEAQVKLKGQLDKFPFRDGSGLFQVIAHCRNVALLPSPGWPMLEKIEGDLDFTGARMFITGKHAMIMGASLSNVTAEIPDLERNDSVLLINGTASGPTAEFFKYIEASPLAKRLNHLTSGMTAAGNGSLQLKLTMPLLNVNNTKVEGSYHFADNRVGVLPGFPLISEINGRLDFTESTLSAREARANFLGMPMSANVVTDHDGTVRISGEGGATANALKRQFGLPLFDHLSGAARWRGMLSIKNNDLGWRVDSDLQGLASSLPDPFNKSAATPLHLHFERKAVQFAQNRRRGQNRVASMLSDEIVLGNAMRMQLLSRNDQRNARIERGLIAIGSATRRLPDRGILLALEQKHLNLDVWRALLANDEARGSATGKSNAFPLTEIDVRAGEVQVFNRSFHDALLVGRQYGTTWRSRLRTREMSALLDWTPATESKPALLSGRIAQLNLPDETATQKISTVSKENLRDMPTLALTVDSLRRSGRDLGSLRIDATTKNDMWNASFTLNNDDGNLAGSGHWNPDPAANSTQLDFTWKAKNIEKQLTRFGHADSIKRGNATLRGSLSWAGAPQALHVASLSGKIHVEAKNGQFNKVEPGLGRLLGVLSLQSLPRRITLDFNDVFSSGFAFDSIDGDMTVDRGVMHTSNLSISGPAAKIRMQGQVDLQHETQDLKVRVQPALGTSLATGVLLVHPVAGAVAWAAQKLLKDPVDQVFAYSYAVTGSWSDPKVAKLTENKGEATPEHK